MKKHKQRQALRRPRWTPQRLRGAGCYWRARVLSTAFDLELFDWLGRGAKGSGAASKYFGGAAQDWEIFLNALGAMGILRKRGVRYGNSAFALHYLRIGKGAFLRPAHDAWESWGSLPGVLTTGKRPGGVQPFFTDRRQAERLLESLDQDGRLIEPYLIRRLGLRRAKNLLDVGGGLGTFSLACCRRFPRLRATLVEHPRVVPLARRAVKKARMVDRVRVVGLDISKDPWPVGFDLVLISNVLHGQGVEENRSALLSAFDSLNPQGRLILRDVLLNADRTDPEWGALFSVALLVHTPRGRCYALDEVRRWLRQAGFSKIQGPFRSSPLFFDPDVLLIAHKN